VGAVQGHGFSFEQALRASRRFEGASEEAQSYVAEHDIPARFDAQDGLPTWVKAVRCQPASARRARGAKTSPVPTSAVSPEGQALRAAEVCMADAKRFWDARGPVRLLLGFYEQKGAQKRFFQIEEFALGAAELDALRGGIGADSIEGVREALRQFGPGPQEAAGARSAARGKIASIEASHPLAPAKLRPKIDSKGQRRLQCALSVEALRQACQTARVVPAQEAGDYGFGDWPWSIESPARQFNKKKKAEAAPGGAACSEEKPQTNAGDE
jgi:hypothetical protein